MLKLYHPQELNHYGLKVHRLRWTKVRLLISYFENIILLAFSLFLDILHYHFVGDVSTGGTEIANAPKVSAPIFFSDFRKFLLDYSWTSAFEVLDYLTDRVVRRYGNKDVDMVGRNIASDDVYTKFFTDLTDDIPGPDGHFALEYAFAVLGYPDQMVFVVEFGMGCGSVVFHSLIVLKLWTESPEIRTQRGTI
jgi:hypothetical protein